MLADWVRMLEPRERRGARRGQRDQGRSRREPPESAPAGQRCPSRGRPGFDLADPDARGGQREPESAGGGGRVCREWSTAPI